MKHLWAVALAALAGTAAAQTPAEKRIEELEKRVQQLEAEKKTPAGDAANTPTWKDLVSLGGHLKWYGFLRLDMHYTDSAFDDPRFPTFVRSEDDTTAVAGVTAAERDDDNFVASARLTRLGFDLDAGKIATLGDAAATGKFEIDFFSLPSSESRAVPRLRHAYGKVGWDWLYILFGQTSDVVSPLWPSLNPDNVMWNWGNTGDRRPQLRICSEPKLGERLKLTLQTMAGQQGAIRNSDVDGLGVRDGDDPGWPELQGRFAIGWQHWVEKKWITLGFSAMYGAEEIDGAGVDGKNHFDTYLYCVDLDFPVFESASGFSVSLKGEWWEGINLADIRGGIGQGINAVSGQEIRSSGGFVELKVAPVKWWAITSGYTRDDPEDHEFSLGMREKNEVWYVMNTFVFSPFTMSVDFGHWRTEFEELTSGTANRVTLWFQLSF